MGKPNIDSKALLCFFSALLQVESFSWESSSAFFWKLLFEPSSLAGDIMQLAIIWCCKSTCLKDVYVMWVDFSFFLSFFWQRKTRELIIKTNLLKQRTCQLQMRTHNQSQSQREGMELTWEDSLGRSKHLSLVSLLLFFRGSIIITMTSSCCSCRWSNDRQQLYSNWEIDPKFKFFSF